MKLRSKSTSIAKLGAVQEHATIQHLRRRNRGGEQAGVRAVSRNRPESFIFGVHSLARVHVEDDRMLLTTPATKVSWSHAFRMYPHLLSLKKLKIMYPWTWERLTYKHIQTGYRTPNPCAASCAWSLLTLHNETFNGISHWIGSLTSLALLIYTIWILAESNPEGAAVLGFYSLCMFLMFSFSASYHTWCSHSDPASRIVQCCDWLGIAVFTFAVNLAVSHVELSAVSRPAFLAFTAVNLAFALFSYFITFSALQKVYGTYDKQQLGAGRHGEDDKLVSHTPVPPGALARIRAAVLAVIETYTFRSLVGCSYALGSIIAWLLGWFLSGEANDHLSWIVGIYACFSTVLLCLFNLPEKLLPPGTVDLLGFSHQIFHVGILVGCLWLWALLMAFYREV